MLETVAAVVKKGIEVSTSALEKTAGIVSGEKVAVPDVEKLRSSSFEALKESYKNANVDGAGVEEVLARAKQELKNRGCENISDEPEKTVESAGLTEDEKAVIIRETGWPPEIVECIQSMEQYEIYKAANLHAAEINGRACLIKDIDVKQEDEFGRTNKERMENGNPPLTESGETVELHHIGQRQDSPLAELTTQEHRGKGNDALLHDKQKESEIDRAEFAKERKHHWESRSENC